MDRTFVAIDVETTGLEAGVDEIIEIGAVKFRGDEVLETFSHLVKPRISLPIKLTMLTGMSAEAVAGAPRFADVAPELVRFVKSYPLVGHSIGFDIRMLQAQGMRFAQPAYDTFDLATLLIPHAPAYRLGALAAALGVAHDEAHRALSDADATRQVFLHLLTRIEALDLADLSEISRLTARMNWSLRDLFGEIERAKAKMVFVDDRPPTTDDQGPATGQPILFGGPAVSAARAPQPIPLKPTGSTEPIDVEAVQRFFAPDGALGLAFAGYEQRPQQLEMAEAVAQAFNNGDNLMVEAGTGTGKGLAYLVPAAMFAAQRGERVVISTNTINLQDQLFFKDIPALQQIMAQVAGRRSQVTWHRRLAAYAARHVESNWY
jgi:DNA polymerase-3 subunit epsilon/ATP-dependent DNA helicase DinG